MERRTTTIELDHNERRPNPRHLGGNALSAAQRETDEADKEPKVTILKDAGAYAEALAYGKQNECTVAWIAIYPQSGATAETTHRMAVILERDTRPDSAPDLSAVNTVCAQAAQEYGPGYVFFVHELYHQDVWGKGVISLPQV